MFIQEYRLVNDCIHKMSYKFIIVYTPADDLVY